MTMTLRKMAGLLAVAVTLVAHAGQVEAASNTLNSVRLRGKLVCGVSVDTKGFSAQAKDGQWSGMDVDLCRAVAAAVLGDAGKVQFVALNAKDRFKSLAQGEVDLLSRNTTWSYARDTSLGVVFAGIIYHDGQGFLVRKDRNAKTLADLNNARICFETGTTTEHNLAEAFAAQNLSYKPVPSDSAELTTLGFQTNRCDAISSDQSELYGLRRDLPKPDQAEIMPLVISKEPLGPAVRQGDDQWLSIVRWTLFAMINAEELGVTQGNLAQMKVSTNPNIKNLLSGFGSDPGPLGLAPGWPQAVIRQVGNYGESFERNLGAKSPLGIARGLNALWNQGGILYAPPFR